MSTQDATAFQDVEVVRGDRRVVWEWIGEGWCEQYDPLDPDDERLLRFSCFERLGDAWVPMDDASYCTGLPVDTARALLVRAAQGILDAIERQRYKCRLEELSWLCPEDFR